MINKGPERSHYHAEVYLRYPKLCLDREPKTRILAIEASTVQPQQLKKRMG